MIYIILCFAINPTAWESAWINYCDDDIFSLFYGLQAFAWFFGTALIVFEYKRSLSEAWYSN